MRRPLVVTLAGLAAALAIGCATSRAFDPETESCTIAADCAVTGFVGCCACDGEPRAVNRAALAKQTEICAVVDCQCAGDCSCKRVGDPRAFAAACRSGRCEAVPR